MGWTNLFSRYIATASLVVVASHVAADDASELTSLLGNLQSASGNFEQTLTDAKGKQLQASSGDFAVKKPGKFRWNTVAPFPQLLVSNGEQLWLYDVDLEQASVSSLSDKMTETPALLLSGDAKKIAKSFTVKKIEAKDPTLASFALTSRDERASFASISASFRQQQLASMSFVDKVGNRTVFVFSKMDATASIDDSDFEFSPPQGTDVIRND